MDSANQALHMFSALHARLFNNNIFFLIFLLTLRSTLLKRPELQTRTSDDKLIL